MENCEICIKCEHCNCVADGYYLCMKDAIPITVIDNYQPSKNYAYCKKNKVETSGMYGPMAYQKEMKPREMLEKGFCAKCENNAYHCETKGICDGYKPYKEVRSE